MDNETQRSFFDTNVLVYLYDSSEPDKQARAREIFDAEVRFGRAIISTQVLQEFYVNVTRKLATPLPVEEAEARVSDFAKLPLVRVDKEIILAAVARTRTMSVSFWDALIVEAAISGGATKLLTEDLNHGQFIDGLEIENPFI